MLTAITIYLIIGVAYAIYAILRFGFDNSRSVGELSTVMAAVVFIWPIAAVVDIRSNT